MQIRLFDCNVRRQFANDTLPALNRAGPWLCPWCSETSHPVTWFVISGGLDECQSRQFHRLAMHCDMDCRVGCGAQDLERVLTGEELQRMESLRLQRALDRMADVVYCPRCHSPTLEDSDGSHCSQCAKSVLVPPLPSGSHPHPHPPRCRQHGISCY